MAAQTDVYLGLLWSFFCQKFQLSVSIMDRLFIHTQFSSADTSSPTAWCYMALCPLHLLCASVRRLCIDWPRFICLLAAYFRCCGKGVKEGDIVTFVASDKNIADIQRYVSQLVHGLNSSETATQLPTVIVIDNLQHIMSFADVFSGFLSAKPANWFVGFAGLYNFFSFSVSMMIFGSGLVYHSLLGVWST